MKKTTALLVSFISIITIISSCSAHKENTKYNYETGEINENVFNDETDWKHEAESTKASYSDWGFQNTDGISKGLVVIEASVAGDYVLSDENGDYVVIMKDSNIHWQFFSQQGQWITSTINDDFSLKSSDVNNITILNNDMATVINPWESYTLSVVQRFTYKNYPVFEISDSYDSDFFIPFDLIDTNREIEFFCEGNTYGRKSYHYYKFYLK